MDRQLYGPPGRASSTEVADAVRLWVEESCERQGVPVKISDPRVLAEVGCLLGYEPDERSRRPGQTRKGHARQSGATRVGSK
jgi:hypothetical protein